MAGLDVNASAAQVSNALPDEGISCQIAPKDVRFFLDFERGLTPRWAVGSRNPLTQGEAVHPRVRGARLATGGLPLPSDGRDY